MLFKILNMSFFLNAHKINKNNFAFHTENFLRTSEFFCNYTIIFFNVWWKKKNTYFLAFW